MRRLGISGMTAMVAMALAQSCTTSDSSFGDRPLGVGQGRLVVDLVDAPNPAVKEIWVTIEKVTAHSTSAGWVTVMTSPLTVDLLKLTTYTQPLGFARLPAGTVTQLRLYVAAAGPQYVVLPDGTQVPLKTPSGTQSGIKIQGPWEVSACNNTEVTVDFDGHKSIWAHPTGHEGEWILRPVIRVKKSHTSPAPCEGPADSGGLGETDGGFDENGGDVGDGGVDGDGEGTRCSSAAECLSGSCVNGMCEAGGPGAPCRLGGDCSAALCQNDGVCSPGSAGGAGSPCQDHGQCLSNTCTAGACEPGGQGSFCQGQVDCADGFSCDIGICQPQVN